MFQRTTAVNKLRELTKRVKVIEGGTSAGKTHGIIPILINKCLRRSNLKVTVVAETIPALREGAVDIFQDVMQSTGRWIQDHWRGQPMEYKFSNGSRIQFYSFENVGRAKAAGKRDILFLNEANHIAWPIADALMIRSKQTWIDYNPDRRFWVHNEVLTQDDAEFLRLTYKDNEACPPEIIQMLQQRIKKAETSEHWRNWCEVYVHGRPGRVQGLIFDSWQSVDRINWEDMQRIQYGVDFGFSSDPTAVIKMGVKGDERYISQLVYQKGLTTSELAKLLKQHEIGAGDTLVCDSADPRSIKDLRTYGFKTVGVKKGKDSIRHGINALHECSIFVEAKAKDIWHEYNNYKWKTDKDENELPVPEDVFNHAIDAIRYANTIKPREVHI
jgi:phage terminase large subunit